MGATAPLASSLLAVVGLVVGAVLGNVFGVSQGQFGRSLSIVFAGAAGALVGAFAGAGLGPGLAVAASELWVVPALEAE